jgi:MoxR-like ATPase
MAFDVMRHRLVLSYEALSDDVSPDRILGAIVERIPVPQVPMQERRGTRVGA